MAKASDETPVTRQVIDEANALFEEYKHIGPAPKAEQEVLWGRMKAALDVLYDKRLDKTNEQWKELPQINEERFAIYEELLPLTSFTSNNINDWNDRTKAVIALQSRWNAIKGLMPRKEAEEFSKKFWAAQKTFLRNKGEFFKQLEARRQENLRLKTDLCEQVEAILISGEESPEITRRVIDLQLQWKRIGQVPKKQKNSIFDRFKTSCDAFFDKRRSRNKEDDLFFEENLNKKIALVERIEAASRNADPSNLDDFKKEWQSIGIVPRRDMQAIQKRYINAIYKLAGAMDKIHAEGRVTQHRESKVIRNHDRDFDRDRKLVDAIRRNIKNFENDIDTYRNNIEFFTRSKNADKLRIEIENKITKAEEELERLHYELVSAEKLLQQRTSIEKGSSQQVGSQEPYYPQASTEDLPQRQANTETEEY